MARVAARPVPKPTRMPSAMSFTAAIAKASLLVILPGPEFHAFVY
jgi:hypothetical protein